MSKTTVEKIVRGFMGDPTEAGEAMLAFTKTAQYVHSNWPQLVAQYNDRWIAAYDEKVQVDGETLEEVIEAIDDMGIPKSDTIIKFATNRPIRLIL